MSESRYMISVIVPVYNVEKYIRKTLDSVIEQTLGFNDNIQVILVDDGSTDGSGKICEEYQAEYPQNIVYINKPNGGVSSARNKGMEYASGTFVTFLDGDDFWGKDAFRAAMEFADEHPDIGLISGRMKFTGRKKGDKYILDYVYKETREVDILKTPDLPLFSLPRTFIRRELMAGIRFDESLRLSEDQLFLTELLLREGKFGVVREAVYYYRKRPDHSSSFDDAKVKPDYYNVTLRNVFLKIINMTIETYGEVIMYVQHHMLTNLRFRMNADPEGVLNESEKEEYYDMLHQILEYISDEAIRTHQNMSLWQRVYFLNARHFTGKGHDPYDTKEMDLYLESLKALKFKIKMQIDQVNIGDRLIISGTAHERWMDENSYIFVTDESGKRYDLTYSLYPDIDRTGCYEGVKLKGYLHHADLPMRKGAIYSFYLKIWDDEPEILRFRLSDEAADILDGNDPVQVNRYDIQIL